MAVFMLGQGVIALFDLDSWIAVMELVGNQVKLLWQHLVGKSVSLFSDSLLISAVNSV